MNMSTRQYDEFIKLLDKLHISGSGYDIVCLLDAYKNLVDTKEENLVEELSLKRFELKKKYNYDLDNKLDHLMDEVGDTCYYKFFVAPQYYDIENTDIQYSTEELDIIKELNALDELYILAESGVIDINSVLDIDDSELFNRIYEAEYVEYDKRAKQLEDKEKNKYNKKINKLHEREDKKIKNMLEENRILYEYIVNSTKDIIKKYNIYERDEMLQQLLKQLIKDIKEKQKLEEERHNKAIGKLKNNIDNIRRVTDIYI